MKNRKRNKYLLLLILLLGISVGYALLSTTLKINGSATITKNNWSVYWDNPVVTDGSVTTTAPELSAEENQTLNTIATWSTTLSLPGDFYEFTIDAVNNGTIDAMITDIEDTVTPTLPSYIKYEVTYEDGTTIENNHLLAKKNGNTPTTEKYKVRVEFLNTITPEQMNAIPEGGNTYTFTYHVTYSQANGDATKSHKLFTLPQDKTATTLAFGDEICIKEECFNFIRYDGNNIVMLAKYNLNVGENAKGTETFKQDSDVKGYEGYGAANQYGGVAFSSENYWYDDDQEAMKPKYGDSFPTNVYDNTYTTSPTAKNDCYNDENSDPDECDLIPPYSIAYYVERYKDILEEQGAEIEEARLITGNEITMNETGCSYRTYGCNQVNFIRNTSFWTSSIDNPYVVWGVFKDGNFNTYPPSFGTYFGVRPVIVVDKNNL